jgi:hypothetical protein
MTDDYGRVSEPGRLPVCQRCEDGLSVIAEKALQLADVLNGRILDMSACELLQPVIRNAYLSGYIFIVAAIIGLFL